MTTIITIFGILLRLGAASQQGTAWFDESFSLHFASMPMADMLKLLVYDVHPPLYSVLLNIWLSVFGATLETARLLSVLLGATLIPLIALIGKNVFDKKTGLIAGALTAISPILLFYSGEARMYPLLLVLVALSTWTFFDFMKHRREHARLPYLWAAVSALMLLTHITAVIPFIVSVIFGAALLGGKRRARFLMIASLSALPFVVWLGSFLWFRFTSIAGEWQFNSSNASGSVLARFVDFFFYGTENWLRSIVATLLILAFLAALIRWKRMEKDSWEVSFEKSPGRWYLAVSAVLPFLLFLPLHTGTIKYLFVAFPSAVLLVAAGSVRLFKKTWIIIGISAVLVLAPTGRLLFERRIQWDAAMDFIEEREQNGDVIYQDWFMSELSLHSYYDGELPRSGAYPYEKELSFDERIVRHAGQISITEETLREMEDFVRTAGRVFLVTGVANFSKQPAQLWFFENGWRIADRFELNEFSPIILLLENPK